MNHNWEIIKSAGKEHNIVSSLSTPHYIQHGWDRMGWVDDTSFYKHRILGMMKKWTGLTELLPYVKWQRSVRSHIIQYLLISKVHEYATKKARSLCKNHKTGKFHHGRAIDGQRIRFSFCQVSEKCAHEACSHNAYLSCIHALCEGNGVYIRVGGDRIVCKCARIDTYVFNLLNDDIVVDSCIDAYVYHRVLVHSFGGRGIDAFTSIIAFARIDYEKNKKSPWIRINKNRTKTLRMDCVSECRVWHQSWKPRWDYMITAYLPS